MEKIKKISILSLYKIGNKGDEAILYKILTDICICDIRVDSVAISKAGVLIQKRVTVDNSAIVAQKVFKNKEKNRKYSMKLFTRIPKFIVQIMKSDYVVFGGGHWIHDYNFGAFFLVLLTAFFAGFFSKVVIFYAIGVGPIKRKYSNKCIKFFLKYVKIIIVRDAESKKILLKAGIDKAVLKVTTDPVINMRCFSNYKFDKIHTKYIVFSPCAWGNMSNYYERNVIFEKNFLKKVIKIIIKISKEKQVIILPTMLPEDLIFANKLKHIKNIKIIDSDKYSPCQLQEIIKNAEFLLSMRLHPIIFAVNTSTPFVCLNYDQKVKNFVDRLQLPLNVCLEEDFFNEQIIDNLMKEIYSSRSKIVAAISESHIRLKDIERNNLIYFKKVISEYF